ALPGQDGCTLYPAPDTARDHPPTPAPPGSPPRPMSSSTAAASRTARPPVRAPQRSQASRARPAAGDGSYTGPDRASSGVQTFKEKFVLVLQLVLVLERFSSTSWSGCETDRTEEKPPQIPRRQYHWWGQNAGSDPDQALGEGEI